MDVKRIKPLLVIFDLDGTLVDTEKISCEMWKTVGAEHGYEIPEDLIRSFIGRTVSSVRKSVMDEMGEDFPFDEIYEEKKERAIEYYIEHGNMKKGVTELLDTLDRLGIRKALATSSAKERAERLLDHHDLIKRFDLIVCGDMVTRSKPNPEIFIKTMDMMNVSPLETIVVEDSKNGIKAAVRSGAFAVLIPDLIHPDDEMKEKSDLIVEDLIQLRDFIEDQQ